MAQAWEAEPGLIDPKSWYEGFAEGEAKSAGLIQALRAALQQISDMGPMSVDDQRWRLAKDTLDALGIKENALKV